MRVSLEVIIGFGSAVLAVLAAITSGVMANRSARLSHDLDRRRKAEDAEEESERVLQLYRDPLLDAAHTLQGRIYNIMAQRYLVRFLLDQPDEQERRYARDYTVYAIAEYLCWVEILRRELRFRDLGDQERTGKLLELLTHIQYDFQRHDIPRQFCIFRGRQRAIAELMMAPTNLAEGPRNECVGYATFCRRLDTDAEFAAWFGVLREDVTVVAKASAADNARLTVLQQHLIDLIDFLDPKRIRIPAQFRNRLS